MPRETPFRSSRPQDSLASKSDRPFTFIHSPRTFLRCQLPLAMFAQAALCSESFLTQPQSCHWLPPKDKPAQVTSEKAELRRIISAALCQVPGDYASQRPPLSPPCKDTPSERVFPLAKNMRSHRLKIRQTETIACTSVSSHPFSPCPPSYDF